MNAGRGFGKTRLGAEWCHEYAMSTVARIAIVAATKDDAEKVCVAGDSGIIATQKPWARVEFKPSKNGGTVYWPNGSIAELYSGENPESLRGPQFHAAWCFPAGTPVAMADGTHRPIERVEVGDHVLTRNGPRIVTASALTNENAALFAVRCVDGRTLVATPNHPVWIDGAGWTRADQIKSGDKVWAIASSGAGVSSGANVPDTMWTRTASGCTERFIKKRSAKYRKAFTSITRMATLGIMTPATLRQFHTVSTYACTAQESQSVRLSSARNGHAIASGLSLAHRVTAAESASTRRPWARLGSSARQDALSAFERQRFSLRRAPVRIAARTMSRSDQRSGSAARPATTAQTLRAPVLRAASVVSDAALASKAVARTLGSVRGLVQSLTIRLLEVASVERLAKRAPVYDIAVEGDHEFFAHGVLVHNCDELAKWRRRDATWDMLRFGLRLGQDPRTVITTTPTPNKLLKELIADKRTARDGSPLVRVTRGSTFANAANLADDFLAELKAKYEGTRLGRQELEAEILTDKPGALWTYTRLEEGRREAPTDLKRCVVAIDPPVTSGEDADEAGIICAAVGADGHGYVLADASERGLSPKQWAEKGVRQYVEHNADCIVAEANNGGEMITEIIRAIDPRIPVKLVYASRGKVTRAEPVSNLYEQGRIHHVGFFKALEDQMCEFTPDFDRKVAGYSPDRVDALVWAISYLMLGTRPSTPRIIRL